MPSAATTRMSRPGKNSSKRAFSIGTASSAVMLGTIGLVGRRGETGDHLIEVAGQPQVGGAAVGRQAGRPAVELHRVVVEVLGAHRQQHAGGGGQRCRRSRAGSAPPRCRRSAGSAAPAAAPAPARPRGRRGRRAGAARGRRRRRTPSPPPRPGDRPQDADGSLGVEDLRGGLAHEGHQRLGDGQCSRAPPSPPHPHPDPGRDRVGDEGVAADDRAPADDRVPAQDGGVGVDDDLVLDGRVALGGSAAARWPRRRLQRRLMDSAPRVTPW